MSHTYVTLEISASAYAEVAAKLRAAGYGHVFSRENGEIDLQGLGLVPDQSEVPDFARAIHYPECWDVAAYPTLESAVAAVYEHARCAICAPVAALAAPQAQPEQAPVTKQWCQDHPASAAYIINTLAARLDAQPEQAAQTQPQAGQFRGPAKWTDEEVADGYRGIRWITKDGVHGRPTESDLRAWLAANPMMRESAPSPAAPVVAQWPAPIQHAPIYPDEDRDAQMLAARYASGWNACLKACQEAAAPSQADQPAAQEAGRVGLTDESVPPSFVEYIARNYSGEVFFSDPAWHAVRIYRAALHAAKAEGER